MTRIKISELVKYDEKKNEVVSIDWEKFSKLEKIAKSLEYEIAEKADKELSKCLLYLCRTKILSKFLEDAYIIITDNAKKIIILPTRDEIKYGFVNYPRAKATGRQRSSVL